MLCGSHPTHLTVAGHGMALQATAAKLTLHVPVQTKALDEAQRKVESYLFGELPAPAADAARQLLPSCMWLFAMLGFQGCRHRAACSCLLLHAMHIHHAFADHMLQPAAMIESAQALYPVFRPLETPFVQLCCCLILSHLTSTGKSFASRHNITKPLFILQPCFSQDNILK